MTLTDLVKDLYDWSHKNHGFMPPYWILKSKDFDEVAEELSGMDLHYPNRLAKTSKVESFRVLDVVIIPFDGHVCPEDVAFAGN